MVGSGRNPTASKVEQACPGCHRCKPAGIAQNALLYYVNRKASSCPGLGDYPTSTSCVSTTTKGGRTLEREPLTHQLDKSPQSYRHRHRDITDVGSVDRRDDTEGGFKDSCIPFLNYNQNMRVRA